MRPKYEEEACGFCDIVAGKAPASMVYEDDSVMAFMDIGPVNPGHVLVIPRKHVVLLSELDEKTGMRLFQVTMKVERALWRSGIRCEGTNLFMANGKVAFQEVFHVHMHVFPRFKGDKFRISGQWPPRPSREEMDRLAKEIRGSLEVGP